jgi:hypothetical protein
MRKLFEPLLPLLQLLELLKERQSRMWDKVVSAENLRVDDQTGDLLVTNGRTTQHQWQPQALALMAGKLRVPVTYLNRCEAGLRAINLNHWLRKKRGQEFFVRFDGENCRAVLSPRYQPISNVQLAESLFNEAGNVLVRAEVDNLRCLIQVITSRGEQVSFGDRIHGGLHVANSEVGHRVVELHALCWRQLCENGLIVGGGDVGFRRRHLGDSDDILRQFRRRTTMAIEAGTTLPGRLGDTRHIRVPDPQPVLDRIARRYQLNDVELEAVRNAFHAEPGNNLWSIIHACTRAGNCATLPVDSREKLQHVGGRVLELAERGTSWID